MDKRDFVPLKRVGTTISPKISGDGLDIGGQYRGALLNNQMTSKATFDILSLMTDPRFLNLQCEDPGAGTMYDVSGQGHDGTYQGSMTTGDRIKKGMSWALDFDGSNDYVNLGDNDDFSFGDGSNDEAVTWFGVFEVVDSAYQTIISKRDETTATPLIEWFIGVTNGRKIYIDLQDNSVPAKESRMLDTALSVGYHSYAITYDGRAGAGAADGIIMYIDGAAVASARAVTGTYVAMENLSVPVWIGSAENSSGVPGQFMDGDNALTGIDGSEWSAYDVHRADQLLKGLYGL